MKKLDVRFDTEKVNEVLDGLAVASKINKSEIARAAMNIGLIRLWESADNFMIELIKANK